MRVRKVFSIPAFSAAVLTICLILVISYGKGFIVKTFVERTIKGSLGLRFSIDECTVSLLNSDVRIKDLVILNPRNFQDKVMFDVTEIYADFDMLSLIKKKPRLKNLSISVDEIFIVKNKEGLLNLSALAVVKASREGKTARDISDNPIPLIKIDSFEFKVRRVVYKDYSQVISPVIIEKDVNINERIENVEDPAFIIRIILVEAVKKAALEQILSINLQALSKPVAKIINAAQQLGKGAITVTQQAGKQITGAVKSATGEKAAPERQGEAGVLVNDLTQGPKDR